MSKAKRPAVAQSESRAQTAAGSDSDRALAELLDMDLGRLRKLVQIHRARGAYGGWQLQTVTQMVTKMLEADAVRFSIPRLATSYTPPPGPTMPLPHVPGRRPPPAETQEEIERRLVRHEALIAPPEPRRPRTAQESIEALQRLRPLLAQRKAEIQNGAPERAAEVQEAAAEAQRLECEIEHLRRVQAEAVRT